MLKEPMSKDVNPTTDKQAEIDKQLIAEKEKVDKQLVVEMTEYTDVDPTVVINPDPNLEYYWDSHNRLSKQSGRLDPGYFIIENSRKERSADPRLDKIARYKDAPRDIHATDSAVRCGDMVLTACLKERAESRKKNMAKKNDQIYTSINPAIRNTKDLREYMHEERKKAGLSERDMKRSPVTVTGGLVMNGW